MAFYIELCLLLIPDYMSSTEIKTPVIFEFSQALTFMTEDIQKIYIYSSLCGIQICGYMLPMTNTTTNLTPQSHKDHEWGL